MRKKDMLKAIVAIAVALAFMLPTSAVFANNDMTVVRFEPPSQTVEKGETFTASVYVEPADWVMGVNFVTISFDPSLLQANKVTQGTLFGGTVAFFDGGTINNIAGTISDGFALEYKVEKAVIDPGSIFVINFTAKGKIGTSSLVMSGVKLPGKIPGQWLEYVQHDGSVTVEGNGNVILTIGVNGKGTTIPAPGGYIYTPGTVVDLEAIHDLGWSFDHWDGDVADPYSAVTNITMNESKSVTANFVEYHYILTVSTVGNGHVDVDPDKEFYLYGETPQLTAVADSGWTFKEWSGDLIGNTNPTTIFMDGNKDVTATFTKGGDTTPPNTEIILDGTMGDNGWYVSAVTVTLVATDGGSGVESTWYRLDGGYWKLYTKPFVVSGEGYHKIEFYSFDRAGNREHPPKIAEFKIDTKPPVTTHKFDGMMVEGCFITNVTVTLSAKDVTSGMNNTMYKINDGIWTVYTNSFVVTENGEYILYYYSVDLAGNTERTNEAGFKIEHDTVPPVTIHTFSGIAGDNSWYKSNVAVVLTASDNLAGVDYTKYKLDDDVEWRKYTGLILVTEDGNHNITYYSVDRVGNKEEYKGPFGFKIDKTVPTINLIWNKEDSKLVATVSDETSGIAKVEFYVNGEYFGEATGYPYECKVTNPKKGDKGQAIAFDNAGNEAISQQVDAIPQGTSQSQSQSSGSSLVILSWIFDLR